MCVSSPVLVCVRLCVYGCVSAHASAVTQILVCFACVDHAFIVYMHLYNHSVYRLCDREQSPWDSAITHSTFGPFNRKPSEICLSADNGSLMLVPFHPYLLTPSAPLGADRPIGGHCSRAESEESKPWPFLSFPLLMPPSFTLPPAPRELPHFILQSHYVSFPHFFFFYLDFKELHLLAHSFPARFPLCSRSSSSSHCLFLPPSLCSSLPCICHSHSPSLFISRLYVYIYPGLGCH